MPNSRPSVDYRIYFDGQQLPDAKLLSARQSVFGASQDWARIEVILTESQRPRWQDRGINVKNGEVSVELVIGDGIQQVRQIHWGKIVSIDASEDETGDKIVLTSRIDDHLFGFPIYRIPVAAALANDDVFGLDNQVYFESDDVVVFNPVIDGKPFPNRNTESVLIGDVEGSENAFDQNLQFAGWVHHDSLDNDLVNLLRDVLTNDPQKKKSPTPEKIENISFWNLPEVINTVCQLLNVKQQYVLNPDLEELVDVLNPHIGQVRNIRLTKGTFLPQILDQILNPLGYYWYVELIDRFQRKIRIRKQGSGDAVALKRQPYDTVVTNYAEEAVSGFRLTYDLADRSANEVVTIGKWFRFVALWNLIPGWITEENDLDLDEYRWEGSVADADKSPGIKDAYRKFVFNENGDYLNFQQNDQRHLFAGDITAEMDVAWDNLNDDDVQRFNDFEFARRRLRFEPIFSYALGAKVPAPSANLGGTYVEYYHPVLDKWLPLNGNEEEPGLSNSSCELLDNEMGIRFNGPMPPLEFFQFAREEGSESDVTKLKLRIVASITVPWTPRVQKTEIKRSNLTDARRIVLERDFVYTGITPAADNVLANYFSEFVLDIDEAKSLTEDAIESFNHATMRGLLSLPGMDWLPPNLGEAISGVQDRNVTYRLTAAQNPVDKYPTVTSVTYDFQQQTIGVELDTWRPF